MKNFNPVKSRNCEFADVAVESSCTVDCSFASHVRCLRGERTIHAMAKIRAGPASVIV